MRIIQSPLNYTGGKFRLLPQILPHFPGKIDTFIDLFCGGCNVGINIDARRVVYNDSNLNLRCLYSTFRNLEKEETFRLIYKIIGDYGLSLVREHGYEHYGCTSGRGVGEYNREAFLRLRADFNTKLQASYYYYIALYVIIVYAFNNQIRFNAKGEYNLPVGKRDFNRKMADKLSAFIDRLKSQNCTFSSDDFRGFDVSGLGGDDFVYADPPYLITCATYNERDGWNEDAERDLLRFLDGLDRKRVRFALSNVLESKGATNRILGGWVERNAGRYRLIELDYSYGNSNYHTRDKTGGAREVLVVNY